MYPQFISKRPRNNVFQTTPHKKCHEHPVEVVRRPFLGKKSGKLDISMSNGCTNYADTLVKRFCRTFCRSHWFLYFHWKSKLTTTFSVRARITSLHKNLVHPTWPHFYEKNAVNIVIWRTFANYARALAKLFCRTFRGAFFYFDALFSRKMRIF